MKRFKIAALILATLLAFGGCAPRVEIPDEYRQKEASEEVVFDIDNIKPGDDFYGYVNARYLYDLDVNPVTGSAGSFDLCSDIVRERLLTILEDVLAGDRSTYELGSSKQIIYDAYYQCKTSEVTMESKSVVNILNQIDAIDEAKDIDTLMDIYSNISNEYGVFPFFNVTVDINKKNSSENILIFNMYAPADPSKLLQGGIDLVYYQEKIETSLRDAGVSKEDAEKRSKDVAYFVMDIAAYTDIELYDELNNDPYGVSYELYTVDELDKLLTNQGFKGISRMFGIDSDSINTVGVYDIKQLVFMDSVLTENNLRNLKDIAICSMISSYGNFIPFDGPDNSVEPDDELILMSLGSFFQDQISELYAEYYYDEEIVNDVYEMTRSIINAYIDLINDSYMSLEGKKVLTDKLNSLQLCIGAKEISDPDPANAKLIGEDVIDTMIISRKAYVQKLKDSLTKPVDREEEGWGHSNVVNAFYNPGINSINIPLGIMLPPFYDKTASVGTNFGGLGVVIGHEISHAFDSDGMNYDSMGNYNPSWIPSSDRSVFDERNELLIEYFSSFTVNDVYHVDGKRTLGENLADIGGIQCVLSILKTNEDKKDMFENYAKTWASVTPNDMLIYYLEVDTHSPDIIRVNAVVAMFDEFYELYDVKEGDAMYVVPENRIIRW